MDTHDASSGLPQGMDLPGSIPGLLRRGSPITYRSDTLGNLLGTIHEVFAGLGTELVVVFAADGQPYTLQGVAHEASLNLMDPTGSVHAAWWFEGVEEGVAPSSAELDALLGGPAWEDVLYAAVHGDNLTGWQRAKLQRVVLHLAGAARPVERMVTYGE